MPPSSSIGALGPSMALGSCGGGRSRARGTGRRATWNRRGFPRCATRGGGGAGAADERVELVKGLGDLLDLEPDLREIGVAARDPKGRKFSESAFVGGSTRNVLQIVVGDHNLPLSSRRTRRRTNRTSCSPRLSGASARTADDPPTQMVTERVPIGPAEDQRLSDGEGGGAQQSQSEDEKRRLSPRGRPPGSRSATLQLLAPPQRAPSRAEASGASTPYSGPRPAD